MSCVSVESICLKTFFPFQFFRKFWVVARLKLDFSRIFGSMSCRHCYEPYLLQTISQARIVETVTTTTTITKTVVTSSKWFGLKTVERGWSSVIPNLVENNSYFPFRYIQNLKNPWKSHVRRVLKRWSVSSTICSFSKKCYYATNTLYGNFFFGYNIFNAT